jgi:hypothetical protein
LGPIIKKGTYSVPNSDIKVIIHAIKYRGDTYFKCHASIVNKKNAIIYERKNYVIYYANIEHWEMLSLDTSCNSSHGD